MNKTKLIVSLIALFFLNSSPALALDATKAGQIKDKTETKKEDKMVRIQSLADLIKDSLATRYTFLSNMKTRLESRIAEKEIALKDMSAAKEKITEFNQPSQDYLQDLNNFENKIGEILTADKPGAIMPELRTAIKSVRTDLNTMHKILADTVKLIISQK